MPFVFNKLFEVHMNKEQQNRAYVKINQIKQEKGDSENIVAYIGSRRAYKRGYHSFNTTCNKTWNFTYKDKNHSSFVVALFNQESVFEDIKLLGEIEIKLSSFKSNCVTNHKFLLRSPDRHSAPITVNLSIHLCEDDSKPFQAGETNILNYEYEVIRRKSADDASIDENQLLFKNV